MFEFIGFKVDQKPSSFEIYFNNQKEKNELEEILLEGINSKKSRSKIKLKTESKYIILNLKDILSIEKIGKKTYFYTELKEAFSNMTLEEAESLSSTFIRINKSQVVNILMIKEVIPTFNMKLLIELSDLSILEVNRKYKITFDNFIGGYYE